MSSNVQGKRVATPEVKVGARAHTVTREIHGNNSQEKKKKQFVKLC